MTQQAIESACDQQRIIQALVQKDIASMEEIRRLERDNHRLRVGVVVCAIVGMAAGIGYLWGVYAG